MDSKEFNQRLADSLGISTISVEQLTEAFASTLRECCKALDTVAVPSFGNITAVKHGEKIAVDPATGKRMLMPPHIDIDFTPGSMLRKHLTGNE